ncbi:hypothetical protein B0T25DRAFT_576639 [Lasiosphaeria hispida]|uniref:AA1-like domain-containing protein n=1 Tax=Lasiosphaeria hispida TaxID=260671 RepID=A0AAJ0HWV6_9PEZI|nr:hypothetical protein B0T25DRAFT_576639 [Lasiosphaeria hispida]
MKSSAIATLFAAVAAHAAPLDPAIRPMLPIDAFNVTGFQAYSVPHSSWSYTKFNISVTTISPATLCSAETLSYQHVGDFAQTNCTEPTVAFNLTRTPDNGAKLDIFWTIAEAGLLQGTYSIPGGQFVSSGVATSVHEDYTGPQSFSIKNLTLVRSVWGS